MPAPLTLITGASQGIGAELARVFASHGHALALVARNLAALNALADEIAATGQPRPMVIGLDLTGPQALDQLLGRLAQEGAAVANLVNNAGYAALGNVADVATTQHLGVIDLNIRVLVELTSRLLPQIRAAKGKILNVASTAAFAPGPGMAVYYATKSFVLSFSEALSHELKRDGVTVTALCPGPTATGFQARAGFKPSVVLMKLGTMDALSVSRIGYAGLMVGKRRVIAGFGNKILVTAMGLTPRSLSLPIIAFLQNVRS